jgi:hypothetical protein
VESKSRSAASIAAQAFEETLERLRLPEDVPDFEDPAALGRRAALVAVAESAWRQALGPLFDTEEARMVLGVRSRQAVHDLAARGRLLSLPTRDGRKLYPAVQFGNQGRPFPELPEILRAFEGKAESPYTVASWLVSPQILLEGETPVAWLRSGRDAALVVEAAHRSASALAH